MTIQLTQRSVLGSVLGPVLEPAHRLHQAPHLLAVALVTSVLKRLHDRLRRAAVDLRAARNRRRLRLQTPHPLDDRIYADLAQARAELEFTYRNNLDLR